MKAILLFILTIIHVIIWLFVLFAFVNKRTAYYNLYYIIPLIFVLHMLPFHPLEEAKTYLYPDDMRQRVDLIQNTLVVGRIQKMLCDCFENSFASPMTPQGMLIFGALSSAQALK
jgi:hypothetical protein